MGVLILCFLRSAKPKEETVQLVGGETSVGLCTVFPNGHSGPGVDVQKHVRILSFRIQLQHIFPLEEWIENGVPTYASSSWKEAKRILKIQEQMDSRGGHCCLLPSKCIFSRVGANGIYRSRYTGDSQLLKRDLARCGEKENHGYGDSIGFSRSPKRSHQRCGVQYSAVELNIYWPDKYLFVGLVKMCHT